MLPSCSCSFSIFPPPPVFFSRPTRVSPKKKGTKRQCKRTLRAGIFSLLQSVYCFYTSWLFSSSLWKRVQVLSIFSSRQFVFCGSRVLNLMFPCSFVRCTRDGMGWLPATGSGKRMMHGALLLVVKKAIYGTFCGGGEGDSVRQLVFFIVVVRSFVSVLRHQFRRRIGLFDWVDEKKLTLHRP